MRANEDKVEALQRWEGRESQKHAKHRSDHSQKGISAIIARVGGTSVFEDIQTYNLLNTLTVTSLS